MSNTPVWTNDTYELAACESHVRALVAAGDREAARLFLSEWAREGMGIDETTTDEMLDAFLA